MSNVVEYVSSIPTALGCIFETQCAWKRCKSFWTQFEVQRARSWLAVLQQGIVEDVAITYLCQILFEDEIGDSSP
jgi:hypothetical protein